VKRGTRSCRFHVFIKFVLFSDVTLTNISLTSMSDREVQNEQRSGGAGNGAGEEVFADICNRKGKVKLLSEITLLESSLEINEASVSYLLSAPNLMEVLKQMRISPLRIRTKVEDTTIMKDVTRHVYIIFLALNHEFAMTQLTASDLHGKVCVV
jgi:hypothetical protein